MLRLAAVTAALVGLSMPALAQFSGDYDIEKWTIGHFPGSPPDQGTVSFGSAPTSITLEGSDEALAGEAASRLEFTIAAPAAGQVSFSWFYVSNDESPSWDQAGYRLGTGDAELFQLSNDSGDLTQGGTLSFQVAKNQTFGFYITSRDNSGGNATLTITNFMAPIPEPASVAMMSLGLLGVAVVAARRRRSN